MELVIEEPQGYNASFECEQCGKACEITKLGIIEGRRMFCGNCGAGYRFVVPKGGVRWEPIRLKFAHGYPGISEWNEISTDGYKRGKHDEVKIGQYRSFWQRLGDFIHNR